MSRASQQHDGKTNEADFHFSLPKNENASAAIESRVQISNSAAMTDRIAFLSALIGRPYKIGAAGPDCFDCYGLARHVQAALYDVPMPKLPFVAATTRQQAEAMLNHAERQNWREIPEHEARDGDLVLMGNVAKRDFHLGTYVVPGTAGVVLHIDEKNGVVADDLPSLRAIGFHYLRIFRRAGTAVA